MEGRPLECATVRDQLRELRRRRLPSEQRDAVIVHLRTCADCRRDDEREALLDRLLLERLPRPEVPNGLRERLASMCAEAERTAGRAPPSLDARRRARRWSRPRTGLAIAALALLAVGGVLVDQGLSRRAREGSDVLTGEAIADHLRAVTAVRPHEIESDDSHNVKPWFEGRLDFAPNVPSEVGAMKLRGGSVGYFLHHKAAVISYALRKHAVTLLAFPLEGLDWPSSNLTLAGVPVRASTQRGIHVVLWRHGDVGYAVVADVARDEFLGIAGQLAAKTGS